MLLLTQYDALHTLYSHTSGAVWQWPDSGLNLTQGKPWNFTSECVSDGVSDGGRDGGGECVSEGVREDPCADDWSGVVCNLTHAECAHSPCHITTLLLNNFNMSGYLPEVFALLSTLHTLSLSGNMLTHSLPHSVGNLTALHVLSLSDNLFTGRIPDTYSNLLQLRILDLKGNSLTHSIPHSIQTAQYSHLQVFYIGENNLSGPIPSLTHSLDLRRIYLTENSLTGPIPSSYYSFTRLQYLGLATNKITGTLSSDIGYLKQLTNFYCGYNSLHSSIPSEVGELSLLEYFLVTKNSLSGTIPSEMGSLLHLLVLELNINSLTGTIPSELGDLTVMHSLYLHDNSLSGTIPHSFTQLASLQLFILAQNELTGTIPEGMSGLTSLYDFSVYNNRLSGEVCGEIFLLPRLEKFLLQNNALTGFRMDEETLTKVAHMNISVSYLDISNNRFHGTIPSHIFSKLNNIVSLAATKNCFTGSLPETLCEARSLEVLTMDGLASGDSCRNKIFYPFSLFDAYLITPLEGSIPHCYWSMPNLTVLHLSGNGLGGSILSDIPEGKLQNISLSFNRITGSIPKYLMEHHFVELSLSNNKLSGIFDTLVFDESTGTSNRSILDISTNRLSGFVPLHICDVDDLSTLEGNLFDCNHHHALPYNDPYRDEYVCASKQLTQPLIVCIAILFSFVVIILYGVALLYRSSESFDDVDTKMKLPWTDRVADYLRSIVVWTTLVELKCNPFCVIERKTIYAPNLKVFVAILRMLRRTFLSLSVVLVVVCIPLYYIMKNVCGGYYSTHEHQYTWTYSIAYMSGAGSAGFVIAIFCISCFFVTFALNVFVKENKIYAVTANDAQSTHTQKVESDAINENTRIPSCRSVASYGIVIVCDMMVYILINSGYIYLLESSSLDSSVKLLANFAMAIIKLFWNLFVVPFSIEFTAKILGHEYHHLKWMIAFLLLFNNIAAPSVATALTDDKCYEQLIAPSCEIDAFYELPVCNIYSLDVATGLRECFEYINLSIETPFNAPFIYNYQCSSSIIVNYVPVFLFVYAFLSLMFPLIFGVLLFPSVYTNLPQQLKDVVPSLLVPPEILQLYPQSPHVPVIRPNRIIATLMSHFAVLLTFGIASPILGFVIGVTVCVLTYMHQLIIGRYLDYHSSTKEAESDVTFSGNIDGTKYSGGLEHACTDFLSGLPACLWTIIVGSNLLFSFIVFDFVGDKNGYFTAMWSALFTIATLPLVVYALYKIALYVRNKHTTFSVSGDDYLVEDSIVDAERPLLN